MNFRRNDMVNYHTLFSQVGAEKSVKKKVSMLQENVSFNVIV